MKNKQRIINIILISLLLIIMLSTKVKATNKITSTLYTIDEVNKLITRIVPKTTVADFKSKLSGEEEIVVYTNKSCNVEITAGKMKTGMGVKCGETIYVASVIGDVNGDGEVTVTDLNNLINYYLKISVNATGDYELTGEHLAAANISQSNSEITLTDINNIISTIVEGDIPTQDKPTEKASNIIDKIEIKTMPNKTIYTVGEKLDIKGLEILAKYNDGSTSIVTTGYTISPAGGTILTQPGTQVVAVTYKAKTATFSITVNEGTVEVTGIKLSETALSLVKGNSETLKVTIEPENATNKKVSWSTDNANIATVDVHGKVTGISTGKTVVTVKTEDGRKTATCNVTVTEQGTSTVPVTGVSLNKPTLSLIKGSSEILTATVTPTDATNKKVNWTSSDTGIATVSAGKVEAIGVGQTTIVAVTEDGGKTATCNVTVTDSEKEVKSICIETMPNQITYNIGDTLDPTGLKIKVLYTDDTTDIKDSGFSCAPLQLNTAGIQIITVTYAKAEATFEVTVNTELKISIPKLIENAVIGIPSKFAILIVEGDLPNTEHSIEIVIDPIENKNFVSFGFSSDNTAIEMTCSEGCLPTFKFIAKIKDNNNNVIAVSNECTVFLMEETPMNSIKLEKEEVTLNVGATLTNNIEIGVELDPENTTNPITASSSDTSIATVTVDNTKKTITITGLKESGPEGVTITVKCGDKEATCTVIVEDYVVSYAAKIISIKDAGGKELNGSLNLINDGTDYIEFEAKVVALKDGNECNDIDVPEEISSQLFFVISGGSSIAGFKVGEQLVSFTKGVKLSKVELQGKNNEETGNVTLYAKIDNKKYEDNISEKEVVKVTLKEQ